MPARSNRIAAECRNTCIVTDFCVSDGQMPSAFCTYLASLNQSSHRRFYAASFAATGRFADGGRHNPEVGMMDLMPMSALDPQA
jgi:hypothetical protein